MYSKYGRLRKTNDNRYCRIGVAALFVFLAVALPHRPGVAAGKATTVDTSSAAQAMPVFRLVQGAKGSPDPYTPRVLDIPAGRPVALDITDNIGGCALVTVFPRLGPQGGTIRARVPVGRTRRVVIEAAIPGRYRYHCSEDMYFGEIVAR